MLKRVMDALLARLDPQPAGIVGVTVDGQELKVERRVDGLSPIHGSRPSVSVSLTVPEAPAGSVQIVLCRWNDMPGVLIYPSLSGGAPRPQWVHLDLVPDGLHLQVKWESEEAPRDYTFEWIRKTLSA